jgi:hypothetical protein
MTSSGFEMPPVQNAFQIWSIWFLISPVSIHLSEFEPAHSGTEKRPLLRTSRPTGAFRLPRSLAGAPLA